MTTLIEVRKGDGRLIGRCDARCYNAKTPRCVCVCGGRNHGAGLQGAIQMTRDSRDLISQEIAETTNISGIVDLWFIDITSKQKKGGTSCQKPRRSG